MKPSSERPREFSHKMRDELINHVGQGATVEEAAQIVGISLRTVQREANYNDAFHHDLALAQHDAPVDPHKLKERAARAHWRAAAWLLERSDPDRFGKRPANSCSPEKLQDIMNYLIELALEATPPEHREAVYRHMRPGADRAFEVLMPDQQESKRWTNALATRRMPLSNIEDGKLLENDDLRSARFGRSAFSRRVANIEALQGPRNEWKEGDVYTPPSVPRWFPPLGSERLDGVEYDNDRYYRDPEDDAKLAPLADPNAAFAAALKENRTWREAADAQRAERAQGGRGKPPAPPAEASSAASHLASSPSASPPDEGIMSPKMHSATECPRPR